MPNLCPSGGPPAPFPFLTSSRPADARGSRFEAVLRLELQKVAAFYVEKEEELAAAVAGLAHSAHSAAALSALRSEIQDLRKYAVLNYYAVVKAAKKRNRHLRAACGGAAVPPLRAVAVLSQQRFFTSPTLAALATQAEILEQVRAVGEGRPARHEACSTDHQRGRALRRQLAPCQLQRLQGSAACCSVQGCAAKVPAGPTCCAPGGRRNARYERPPPPPPFDACAGAGAAASCR
jgi:predicted component of type VI protein secretion system